MGTVAEANATDSGVPSFNCTPSNRTLGFSPTRDPTGDVSIAFLSITFFIICFMGIFGNCLVILVVLFNKKMRKSETNLFIVNIAIADLLIMLFGVPEIAQFVSNKGWLLGSIACKVNRCILVTSLYSSILTMLGVSIERYECQFIVIVHKLINWDMKNAK